MDNKLNGSQFLLYETEDGNININVILKDENIWLTQKGCLNILTKMLKQSTDI